MQQHNAHFLYFLEDLIEYMNLIYLFDTSEAVGSKSLRKV